MSLTRQMPRVRTAALGAALCVALCGQLGAQIPTVRIGTVLDGPWEGNETVRGLTRSEVQKLTEGEFDVRFPEEAYLVGDWTIEIARQHLDQLLADPSIDIVIAWGVLASQLTCCYESLSKPVIAPAILDIELQRMPYRGGVSGFENLTYVALPDTLSREIDQFRQIVPFHTLAVLANQTLLDATPLQARSTPALDELGIELTYVGITESAADVLARIPEGIDAVYAWPLYLMSPDEAVKLIAGLNERKIPTFYGLGREGVEAGMLATSGYADFFPRLSRRIALNVQSILLGEDAGDLPVHITVRRQLIVNMATARAIGVSPRWSILDQAELLHAEEVDDVVSLSLGRVVQQAIVANLDLEVRRRDVEAMAQDIVRSRSQLLPQLDAGLLGSQIDEDRARASFGQQFERQVVGSATLRQLLYSDQAWAGLRIEKDLQAGRELDFQVARLDIALDAAVTYLNLLRAKRQVGIQRNNLELTRSNLQLAQSRLSVGAASPAEVYRWESQVATDRKALIEAFAGRRIAEIAINRLLDQPLDRPFITREVALDDPSLITGQDRFVGYTETPRRFAVFSDFLVVHGLDSAPELAQIQTSLSAQERALLAARRAYWAPTIGAEASLDERLETAGVPENEPPPPFDLPTLDDTSWAVGISIGLPLFTSGQRKADRVQAELRIEQIETFYDSVAQKIEQRIRTGLELTRASYAGIQLSEQAAEAAGKNLELVSESYARGAVSIITLLDAQNASLNTNEVAADALYDFLIDLMEVQRAANQFDFFVDPASRDEWFRILELHFSEAGLGPLEP